MGLFSNLFTIETKENPPPATTTRSSNIATVEWVKNPSGRYFRLISINEDNPKLIQQGGVIVIWANIGPKVIWLAVASTADLSRSIKEAKDNPVIMEYEGKGRVGITWALSNPKYRNRIAAYLKKILKPLILNPDFENLANFSSEPFAVYPPAVH